MEELSGILLFPKFVMVWLSYLLASMHQIFWVVTANCDWEFNTLTRKSHLFEPHAMTISGILVISFDWFSYFSFIWACGVFFIFWEQIDLNINITSRFKQCLFDWNCKGQIRRALLLIQNGLTLSFVWLNQIRYKGLETD